MRFRRLPNKFGTITKLSGTRRKPWCAKIYDGEKVDDEKHTVRPVYRSIGTFSSYNDAFRALSAANQDKEEYIRHGQYTFEAFYTSWIKDKRETISKSHLWNLENAHKNLAELHNMDVRDISSKKITSVIQAIKSESAKNIAVLVCNGVFRQAMFEGLIDSNPTENHKVTIDNTPKIKRSPMTLADLKALMDFDHRYGELAMVQCYSGMREAEAQGLAIAMVDMEHRVFRGAGKKTKAGKSRVIPIHRELMPLIKRLVSDAKANGRDSLFPFTLEAYNSALARHTTHRSHECRIAFATAWKLCGLPDLERKLVLGHTVKDITDNIYTRFTEEHLVELVDQVVLK